MRRVKATQVQTRLPLYVDLDACPLIVRGKLMENDKDGRPQRTLDCTILYMAARTQGGGGLVEYVDETPEELFDLAQMHNRGAPVYITGLNGAIYDAEMSESMAKGLVEFANSHGPNPDFGRAAETRLDTAP